MNIQIFGKSKCFATRSAERFFKERKINYQYIDLGIKGMSLREIESTASSLGNIDLLIDNQSALYKSLQVDKLRSREGKIKCLVENPKLLRTPIVRDCDTKKATVGESVDIWKSWLVSK